MEQLLRQRAESIWTAAIRSVLPDEAVRRALEHFHPQGRVFLVAAGKAAWQMAHAALAVLGCVDGGIVITKYGHVRGPLPGVTCCEAGHPVPDDNSFAATQRALALVSGLRADDTVLFLLSGGGSVRELCRAAADACRAEGYEPVLLTDCLCCEAREAGSFLGSIARTHAGQGRKRAFIAGGETVVHLTGHGLGGRNQELALAAAPALAGLRGCCVFSVGSDGTDGPTDAAGGYADGEALAALTAAGLDVPRVLADNDAYHALQAVGGLIMTGPTGTNVNDVAVVLTE